MIVLGKLAEIYPLFKCGKETEDYISKMIIYFYKVFTRSFYLLYMSISGTFIKLPKDWKENSSQIIAFVRFDKTPQTDDNGVPV